MKNNILLVVIDCLGSKHLDILLSRNLLPTFRKIIVNGVYFCHTITTSTHTTPSFASLVTGLYPPHHGVWGLSGFKLISSARLLPEILANDGYKTRAWVTGPLHPAIGLDKGWDSYIYREQSHYLHSETGRGYLDKLKSMGKNSPWFTLLHLWELHRPRQTREANNNVTLTDNYYERSLLYLDDILKQVLSSINLDNTNVIVVGDHGENVNFLDYNKLLDKAKFLFKALARKRPLSFIRNDHGFHVYEDMINVPLMFIGPDFPSGFVIRKQVSTIDIFYTILSLAGIDKMTENNEFAQNLCSLFSDATTCTENPCFVFTAKNQGKWPEIHCVRNFPWKYYRIYKDNKIKKDVLINLLSDPFETCNIKNKFYRIYDELKSCLDKLLAQNKGFGECLNQEFTEQETRDIKKKLKDLGYL